MLKKIYNRSINFFSKHPILNSLAHSAGGFGLAILLQHYFTQNMFLTPCIAWLFIIFSIMIHVFSFIKV